MFGCKNSEERRPMEMREEKENEGEKIKEGQS